MGLYPLSLSGELLGARFPAEAGQHGFDRFLHHRVFIVQQRQQRLDRFVRAESSERLGGVAADQPILIL
jgi:hypothetical protein